MYHEQLVEFWKQKYHRKVVEKYRQWGKLQLKYKRRVMPKEIAKQFDELEKEIEVYAAFSGIVDGLTLGNYTTKLFGGHGSRYWAQNPRELVPAEIFADLFMLRMLDTPVSRQLLEKVKFHFPDIYKAFEAVLSEVIK